MALKLKIAKAGYDVLQTEDPNNLIFSSDYNTLKYFLSGSYHETFDFADFYFSEDILGTTWYYHRKVTTIAHNLGYTPFFVGYVEGFGGAGRYNMCPGMFADFLYYSYVQCYADDTNIYFVIEIRNDSNSGGGSADYIYKVFKNKLNL
jgi:hypothetical protein